VSEMQEGWYYGVKSPQEVYIYMAVFDACPRSGHRPSFRAALKYTNGKNAGKYFVLNVSKMDDAPSVTAMTLEK
jgi:hypothetical protein